MNNVVVYGHLKGGTHSGTIISDFAKPPLPSQYILLLLYSNQATSSYFAVRVASAASSSLGVHGWADLADQEPSAISAVQGRGQLQNGLGAGVGWR
jgi:hypothetical protein